MTNPNLSQQLLDTWNIHDRINLYLLDAISPDALTLPNKFSPSTACNIRTFLVFLLVTA